MQFPKHFPTSHTCELGEIMDILKYGFFPTVCVILKVSIVYMPQKFLYYWTVMVFPVFIYKTTLRILCRNLGSTLQTFPQTWTSVKDISESKVIKHFKILEKYKGSCNWMA